eukprot:12431462-Karenia_brevis.AAC.1
MSALKLTLLGDSLILRTSSSNGATHCLCQPFSHAEMSALKLIMLCDRLNLRISSINGHAEMAAQKMMMVHLKFRRLCAR